MGCSNSSSSNVDNNDKNRNNNDNSFLPINDDQNSNKNENIDKKTFNPSVNIADENVQNINSDNKDNLKKENNKNLLEPINKYINDNSQNIEELNKTNSNNSNSDVEETKEEKQKQKNIKLKILLFNLEARNADIDEIKTKLSKIFEEIGQMYERQLNTNRIKNYLINKIFETLNKYLKIPEANIQDMSFLKDLITNLYHDNDNIKEYEEYLYAVLDNYINFNKSKSSDDEDKIVNYIVRFMKKKEMQDKKENLKNQYKDNNGIIKYDDFSKLIQKEEIYMENLANEYLLYKMKKAALNENSL